MKIIYLSAIAVAITINCSYAQWTTSGSNIYNSNTGNVGIGTTVLYHKLELVGPAANVGVGSYTDVVDFTSNNTFAINVGAGIVLGGKYNTAGSSTEFAQVAGVKENSIDGDYNGSLTFGTRVNGAYMIERMRVTSTGNVGIGTTAPGTKLHIAADANTSGAPDNAQFYITGSTSSAKRLSLAYNTSSNYGEIQAQAFGGSYSPLILNPNGGNIGIGTTSPIHPLDIIGTARVTALNVKGMTSTEVNGLSGTGMGYNPTSYPVSAFGILSGSGVTAIGYDPLTNTGGNFSGDGSEVLFRNIVNFIQPNAAGTDFLSPSLTLNNGNIGIATTNTQGYKFAVNGSAIATSMTVKLYANWPDYVFKKDYHLPKLADVKNYIDANHRLPEMPSEQEVTKNGLNLGEMNRLLTKKVEELTLYLIAQNERIKQQEEIDRSLKNEIAELRSQVKTLINYKK